MGPVALAELLGRAREIARDVVSPLAAAVDHEARWPTEAIRALLDAGLGGLVIPARYGGAGHGLEALAAVCEILGRACASTALCFGMHSVAAACLSAKPTRHQVEAYLEPIARGRHLTTLALSEPGSGAHFYFPETRLEHVAPGTLRVHGTKSFVTNAGHADSYVVSLVAGDPDAPPGHFSMLVVPRDAPGVGHGPEWRGLGVRGNSARTVTFEGVDVTEADLLGAEGDQIWYVFSIVAPYFLMAMAGTYLGVAAAALDETRERLTDRRYSHSGASLSEASVLQHRFGTLWAMGARSRALVAEAARAGDRGDPEALALLCAAKADVADCAVAVTNEAMTLGGGRAYGEHSAMHRHLRDARAAHVMAPTTDLLRVWTGRALLDQPLLAD